MYANDGRRNHGSVRHAGVSLLPGEERGTQMT